MGPTLPLLLLPLLLLNTAEAAVHFHERFDDLDPDQWQDRWGHSASTKHDGKGQLTSMPDWDPADKALKLPTANRRYGISALLPKPLYVSHEGLVLQYEARHSEGYTCGGSYLKLITHRASAPYTPQSLDESTPYTIMFGPDLCGSEGKVHLILRHTNPLSGNVEERHLVQPAKPPQDSFSHVYTLHLEPPSKFTVLVDGKVGAQGDLLAPTTFAPPFQPPSTIADPQDRKPDDWEEQEMIPDVAAIKPPNHDERERVPDPQAVKPKGWLDHEAPTIPDPAARKPPLWDDEEDGEWAPPQVPNPKCKRVGCGTWQPPLIKNPDYKAKWTPPYIKNPKYKGIWKPRQIPNPHYWHEEAPLESLGSIAAVALEVWTVDRGFTLDNLVITSVDDPLPAQLREQTWKPKHTKEVEEHRKREEARDKAEREKKDKDARNKKRLADKAKQKRQGINPLARAILSAFKRPPLKAYRPYVRPLLKLLRQSPWMAYPLVLTIPACTLLALALKSGNKSKRPAARRAMPPPGGDVDASGGGGEDEPVPDLVPASGSADDVPATPQQASVVNSDEEEELPQPPTYGMPPLPPDLNAAAT